MDFLIGVLIIGGVIAVAVHRGFQMKNLAHDGVVAEGTVTERFRRNTTAGGSRSSAYLCYEFKAADGLRYQRKIAVGEEIYDQYAVGDTIDVVYLQGKPKVSAARYMVNLSREALKLPPL